MSFIKMFATQAASAVTVSSSFDVPRDGYITSVLMGCALTSDTAPVNGQQVVAECSFSSAPQFQTNDVRNSLGQCSVQMMAVTAATPVIGLNSVPFFVAHNLKIRCFAGERIFLHLNQTATIEVSSATAFIYIEDGDERDARPRSRRG